MSTVPLGLAGSLAAAPFAQQQGVERERGAADVAARARRTHSEAKAEAAAGVGQTEERAEAGERDADGRRLWEAPPQGSSEKGDDAGPAPPRGKDADGARGAQLDLDA